MDIKSLAKGAIKYSRPKEKCCIGVCRHRQYRYNGNHYCEIIGDYMDGNYTCPKYDDNYKYCEMYDTYCWIENQCLRCPISTDDIESTFMENIEDNKYDNGGFRR